LPVRLIVMATIMAQLEQKVVVYPLNFFRLAQANLETAAGSLLSVSI